MNAAAVWDIGTMLVGEVCVMLLDGEICVMAGGLCDIGWRSLCDVGWRSLLMLVDKLV